MGEQGRKDEPGARRHEEEDTEGTDDRPLGGFGDPDKPQAEPAAGEAPLEHLVTGRFGDTTPDPPSRSPRHGAEEAEDEDLEDEDLEDEGRAGRAGRQS